MANQPVLIEQIMRTLAKQHHLFKDWEFFPTDKIEGEEEVVGCLIIEANLLGGGIHDLSYYSLNSLFRAAVTLGASKAFQTGIPEKEGKDFSFRDFNAPDKTIEKFDEANRDDQEKRALEDRLALELFFTFEDWMLENRMDLRGGEISFKESLAEALLYSYLIAYFQILE